MLFFSRWTGMATAQTSKFVGVQRRESIYKTSVYSKHAFRPRRSLFWHVLAYVGITKAAILRYALNIVHNSMQLFGFVNASILLIKSDTLS